MWRELIESLREINERLQEHNRRIAGTTMRGKCSDVDTSKQLCRIVIGKSEDGAEVKSPWVPYKQTAGAVKLHNPPSVGQVMEIRSETGDIEQGLAEPFRWNDDNQTPSQAEDEHVLTFGDVRATLKGGNVTFTIGGVTVDISGGGLAVTGGTVTHNEVNIGFDHKHEGVTAGGDESLEPVH
jgi:phage baseplate assembly protein gpV